MCVLGAGTGWGHSTCRGRAVYHGSSCEVHTWLKGKGGVGAQQEES